MDNKGIQFGDGAFAVIAGPCCVEDEAQMLRIARAVKAAGATMLRGGAFKPRTSPKAFQGLGAEGLRILSAVKRETGLPVVTELMDVRDIPLFDDVDVIQVGSRNMQNFALLKEVGLLRKPVLLKRGFCSTLKEFLGAADYIRAGGNEQVVLCERGIRTFETSTRNTPDLVAVPLLKELSGLPVIVDPSHATGVDRLVPPMAFAATAAGADGLIVEVHDEPKKALCDGDQSITPEVFADMLKSVDRVRRAVAA